MKNLSTPFRTRLKNGGTLAYGLRIILSDGLTRLGYSSFGRSLTFDGVTFRPNNGVNPGANQSSINLNVGNSEAKIFFDDAEITEQQLLSGLLDNASVLWFIFDWQFPPTDLDATINQSALILMQGNFGKFSGDDLSVKGEILSIEDKLSQSNPIVTQPRCRNTLGDIRCGATVASFIGTVTNSGGATFNFTIGTINNASVTGECSNGRVEWISGSNAGSSAKISEHNDGEIILSQLPYRSIQPGDSFRAFQGCDKTTDDCLNRFNNILNYRGEPHLPGTNALIRGPR